MIQQNDIETPVAVARMADSATALISTGAICRNIAAIRRRIPPGTPICAAVKADAYGHGLDQVLPALSKARVERLAVANLEEALGLRRRGWAGPVLSFGSLPAGIGQAAREEHAIEAVTADVSCTISTAEEAELLLSAARRLHRKAHAEIQVDSGMGRCGVRWDIVFPLLSRIAEYTELTIDGLYMHFATADEQDVGFAREQLTRFGGVIEQLKTAKMPITTFHAANSAAIFRIPESHLDMVRPGLSVYGYWGGPDGQRPDDLQPIMRVVSHLTEVRHLPAGAFVGYGCTFVTRRESVIGTIPVGYADGYRRLLSNKGVLTLRARDRLPARVVPVVGRVSMDQINVDLTEAGPVAVGEEVVIISEDPAAPNSVEALALLANTIPYEVTTLLGRRVRRVAVD